MSQSTLVALAIVALFLFYIAAKGRLPAYMQALGLAQGSGAGGGDLAPGVGQTAVGGTTGSAGGVGGQLESAAIGGASKAVSSAADRLVSNFFASSPLGPGEGDFGGA